MGLMVRAKHLSKEDSYDCGYITFSHFRIQLAKTYNKEFGCLYEKWVNHEITEDELERVNELSNEDLDIFLNHSDYEGKFTPKECKKIYDVIKDYKMDMLGHNYGIVNNP